VNLQFAFADGLVDVDFLGRFIGSFFLISPHPARSRAEVMANPSNRHPKIAKRRTLFIAFLLLCR